ncbi:MAG: hypothetical protein WBD02_10210 [Acidimicrobiia bacterium]
MSGNQEFNRAWEAQRKPVADFLHATLDESESVVASIAQAKESGLISRSTLTWFVAVLALASFDVYRRLALANEFRWINLPSLVIALTLAHLATPQYALVATENRVLVLRKNLGSKTVKEVSSSFDRGSCSVTTQIRTSGIKMKTRFGDSPRSYTAPTFLAADVEAFEAALHPFSAQKGRGWGAVEQVPPTSGPTAYHQLHTNGIERSARAEGDFSGQ